jgi:hypothetical protein
MNIIKNRGYDLSAEDSAKVYEEFVKLSKKKSVNLKELDFIIASNRAPDSRDVQTQQLRN